MEENILDTRGLIKIKDGVFDRIKNYFRQLFYRLNNKIGEKYDGVENNELYDDSLERKLEHEDDKIRNLNKLKERLNEIKNGLETEDVEQLNNILTRIDELNFNDANADEVLEDVYMEYEILNRRSFLNLMFAPHGNSVITSKNHFSNMLLHFFDPTPYDGGVRQGYIKRVKEEIEKRRGKTIDLEDEELKRAIKHFEDVLSDKKIVKEVANSGLIYKNGEYLEYDSSRAAAQMSLQTFSSQRVILPNATGGFSHDEFRYALGFDSGGVTEEDILVMSAKNLISLKGVNNLQSDDEFADFSATLNEMNKGEGRNDEVIVSRNTVKPSYLLLSVPKQIILEDAKEKLIEARQLAESIGVKLVILDQHSIFNELEKSKDRNKAERGMER